MFENVQRNFRKWSLEMRGQPHHGSAVQGQRRMCVVLEHISETPCIVYVSLASLSSGRRFYIHVWYSVRCLCDRGSLIQ